MADSFSTRALEIHSEAMWREAEVLTALDFIVRNDLNALVFHDGDILNQLVFPRRYFPAFSQWGSAPPRRGENRIYNSRAYLSNILSLCAARGVSFFLEVKELTFPDEILEYHPDLMIEGRVCPTDPKWREFVEARYQELLDDFPGIAGIIVSVGSPEGRATLASGRCGCQRCHNADRADWYRTIIEAMYRPISGHGKRLVVREFSYTPADQRSVLDGLDPLPADVELCLKPYPRDFYPTYPDNAALNELPGRPKWLEYDVHGQYFGWGVFPCPIVDDLRRRIHAALDADVTSISLRTDWERVNDLSCLHTANLLNLSAGALLSRRSSTPAPEALGHALNATGMAAPTDGNTRDALVRDLLGLWPIVAQALYIRGFLFNHNSCIPHGARHGWWNMTQQHNLAAWDPSAAQRVDVIDTLTTAAMLAEKDQALAASADLMPRLRTWIDNGVLHLPDPCHIDDIVSWMTLYVETFVRCGKLIILCAASNHRDEGLGDDEQAVLREEFPRTATALRNLEDLLSRSEHSHHVQLLTELQCVERVLTDAADALDEPSRGSDVPT